MHMPNCHIPLLGIFLLLLSACRQDTPPLKPYFFPIAQMGDGMVYRYENAKKVGRIEELWAIQSHRSDSGYVLLTRIFTANNILLQEKTEWEVGNGVLLLSSTYHARDSLFDKILVPLEIQRDNVFPYELPDSGRVYIQRFRYPEPNEANHMTTLTRIRRYSGMDTLLLKDGPTPVVVFDVHDIMENEGEGILQLEIHGREFYGKGLGLAAWEKYRGRGDTLRMRLHDRMPLADYQAKYGTWD
jgi:hypothetical protein